MQIVDADERDTSWEAWSPTFRLFIYTVEQSQDGEFHPTSRFEVFDISDADLSDVVQFAEENARTDQVYSIAVVVDSDAELPGERGLLWLTGLDIYGTPSTPAQYRARVAMFSRPRRRST